MDQTQIFLNKLQVQVFKHLSSKYNSRSSPPDLITCSKALEIKVQVKIKFTIQDYDQEQAQKPLNLSTSRYQLHNL